MFSRYQDAADIHHHICGSFEAGENIQDEKVRGYIDVLDKKSQRLKNLTEDLVEASKISSGNIKLEFMPIDFVQLIWQTNGEFEEKFAARGLNLVCSIPEGPIYVMADGRRLWRVVENLYNNTAKYALQDSRYTQTSRQMKSRWYFR